MYVTTAEKVILDAGTNVADTHYYDLPFQIVDFSFSAGNALVDIINLHEAQKTYKEYGGFDYEDVVIQTSSAAWTYRIRSSVGQ